MAEHKHTDGPWQTREMQRIGLPFVPIVATTLIAKVYSTCMGDDEQALANAHLMAAAPELLTALQGMLETFADPETGEVDRKLSFVDARAAIAKATGGSA